MAEGGAHQGVARPRRVRVGVQGPPRSPGRGDAAVRVELLTDPWSVWCWGFEPVRRTLELRYPTIDFRFLLGGMFPQMPDHRAAGFDVERFFEQVHRTTGMPVGTQVLKGDDPPQSTFPACEAVHAARIASPGMEDRYLRALREAVYLDGRNVSDGRVAQEVATVVGVDPDRFHEALSSGKAGHALRSRLSDLTQKKLFAYPTLLVTFEGRSTRVEGFQSLPAVLAVVEAVTGRLHPPLPDPPLSDVLPFGERLATREVAEVLGVSVERAYDLLARMEEEGVVAHHRHPKADIWVRLDAPDA